jgi:Fanconi anemia group M protein
MAFLLSPTERELKPLLGEKAITSYLPERYGADILAIVEGRGHLAIQRKTFPDDLLASLGDGRLARELSLLAHTEYPVLIVEGKPMWTADGHLMQPWRTGWTRAQLRNMLRSAWRVHGVAVEHTDDINDTAAAILELETWFRKDTHRSLLSRHKSMAKDSWGLSNKRDMARFLLQGLPGIGCVLAEQIFDTFGRVPLRWDCTYEELLSVYGIGEKRAKALWEALQ